MRKIFAFGNEYVKGDEIAKIIAKNFKSEEFEFISATSPNEILKADEELIILDVVKGIKEPKIINEIDDLILDKSLTCHDLDLGFYLKLMKECGKISKAKIIGLPYGNSNIKELTIEVEKLLSQI